MQVLHLSLLVQDKQGQLGSSDASALTAAELEQKGKAQKKEAIEKELQQCVCAICPELRFLCCGQAKEQSGSRG